MGGVRFVIATLALAGCGEGKDGGSADPVDSADASASPGDADCGAGPSTLDGLAVAFARSATEVEVYRFGPGTFTRDLAPGELSENTGTWTWTGAPDCRLDLAHAAVPPDWPEAFASEYVVGWTSGSEGTFSMTRTFSDGFTFSGTGSVEVLP